MCNGECFICYDSYDKKNSVKLPCGHRFHARCIAEWFASLAQPANENEQRVYLMQAFASKTFVFNCPYCRAPVNMDVGQLFEWRLKKQFFSFRFDLEKRKSRGFDLLIVFKHRNRILLRKDSQYTNIHDLSYGAIEKATMHNNTSRKVILR